ncbi:hypothetical protein EPA93_28590 [Ktedonosporobacter rubrisoli]|uniref:Uncharacterized protein n=1 Tax=Ktedonosporobacter rubrisoli TaxID=2509675 RepID=A0A4P6JWF9_KTERU|nr:hypothetical protein [Ktedonosporobacter rubrisoli]QBD79722.1 hypothetical protein EPA93_28590 [Ktedonosporobacter rubrisoli]
MPIFTEEVTSAPSSVEAVMDDIFELDVRIVTEALPQNDAQPDWPVPTFLKTCSQSCSCWNSCACGSFLWGC